LNTFTLLDEIFGVLKITKQWVVVGAVHHLLERVEFEDLLDLLIKLLLSLLSQRRRLLHHLGHQFLQNCIRLLFWNNVQLLLGLLLVMLVSLPFIGALTGELMLFCTRNSLPNNIQHVALKLPIVVLKIILQLL
jgi:hypothetical protein